jgi:hypothetical protein
MPTDVDGGVAKAFAQSVMAAFYKTAHDICDEVSERDPAFMVCMCARR